MRKLLVFLGCLVAHTFVLATHNRAGEISIEQVGDCVSSLTVRATVITYTKASSRPADRDSLTIVWGDGTSERVVRVNGPGGIPQGEILENDTKKNIYVGVHTYPARATYIISMTDPNRNADVVNVNFPNSDQVTFHIQTTYTFPNPQFQGCNNTPILLQPPIDIGCVGKPFRHNPNAYDADGDSLSYHLIVPLATVQNGVGVRVPNYVWPFEVSPGPRNKLTINEVTGDIVWDAPQRAGEYNLAMIIVEYRQGVPIDTIIRDMQILVENCNNLPPVIETPFDEVCVVAGELLEFDVVATAPLEEMAQKVKLSALGGPFEVPVSPATFLPGGNRFEDDPKVKKFRWQTTCEHISDQFYSVVFKAVDNFFDDTLGLATLKTLRIKVVGPPPEDVQVNSSNGQVLVTWGKPYSCENAEDDYFQGFTVWRREGSNPFPPDTCQPGLNGKGYTLLTRFPIDSMRDGRYFYRDSNVERGKTYCYRILAEFAKLTPGGQFTYNTVFSLPSQEVCVQLSRDAPIITQVSILSTATATGQTEVCWVRPIPGDLDTLQNKGPYRFEVLRAEGLSPAASAFQPIGVNIQRPFFANLADTCIVDTGLNTAEKAYSYKINFYVNGENRPISATNSASSVRLSASPTDQAVNLSWQANVPWQNIRYIVFRKNAQGVFDSLTTVAAANYTDSGLVNGTEYCYLIEAYGTYGFPGVPNTLINRSQEICARPFDNVPPCFPDSAFLAVETPCEKGTGCDDGTKNILSWKNPQGICPQSQDLVSYEVYYADREGGELQLIETITTIAETSYAHRGENTLAGCYAIKLVDDNGNRSGFSNVVCVDNCPIYLLPNTFTPNTDNQNDIFKPYPYCFVSRVNFKVFDRWGGLVFSTENPDLNWDGKNTRGELVSPGTYYYVCEVFETRLSGVSARTETLNGWLSVVY